MDEVIRPATSREEHARDEHLRRQRDLPENQVMLADGTIRFVGGVRDNEDEVPDVGAL